MSTATPAPFEPAFPKRLVPLYAVEGITTFGTMLLQLGFFFYATDKWGWQPRHNLLLATCQGVLYVLGALGASHVTRRIGRKNTAALVPLILAALSIVCGIYRDTPSVVAPVLVVYFFFVSLFWPGVESLVAAEADPHGMSRRLSVYNLFWPGVAAGATAISGTIIDFSPASLFYFSTAANVLSALVVFAGGPQPEEHPEPANRRTGEPATDPLADSPIRPLPHSPPHAEPELLHQRKLALWLSRIALPSTYLVIYALSAIMPTLPTIANQSTAAKTAIGSAWLVGRFLAFGLLALSVFWHTRPRLLILAAAGMLLTFLGICIPVSRFTGAPLGSPADLTVMVACQLLLGLCLALIYSASLYFGMVLSEGSTEHGGYHEALIGVGQVLGPGIACIAQILHPGSITPTVIAISAMLLLSLGTSLIAMLKLRDPD